MLPRSLAEKTHAFVIDNFGLIGREWIDIIKDNINDIKAIYRHLVKDFRKKRLEAMSDHINLLAAAFTADIIFNDYFFNVDINTALAELQSTHIFNSLYALTSEFSTNNLESARDYINEFFFSRRKHFVVNGDVSRAQDPIFGEIKGAYVSIYQHKFRAAMVAAGFSEGIINELIANNYIEREDDKIPKSYKVNWQN